MFEILVMTVIVIGIMVIFYAGYLYDLTLKPVKIPPCEIYMKTEMLKNEIRFTKIKFEEQGIIQLEREAPIMPVITSTKPDKWEMFLNDRTRGKL